METILAAFAVLTCLSPLPATSQTMRLVGGWEHVTDESHSVIWQRSGINLECCDEAPRAYSVHAAFEALSS